MKHRRQTPHRTRTLARARSGARAGGNRGRSDRAAARLVFTLLAALVTAGVAPLAADHFGFSPCPTSTATSTNPPTRIVKVSIQTIRPNSDLEGDDDFIPFYDNQADIY